MKKAYVFKLPIGMFAFSGKKLVYYELFSKDPGKALVEFLGDHKGFYEKLKGYEIVEAKGNLPEMREYALSLGFASSEKELNEFLSGFGVSFSKKRVTGFVNRDRLIIKAVNALDDMKKSLNMFLSHLDNWFMLHYPEAGITQKDLAKKIAQYGRRENFPSFSGSVGISFTEKDEETLKHYASVIMLMQENEKKLESYVTENMRESVPNVSSIAGPLLGARLISLAGSLEKLSKMASSTIQLLGSEKALFRHIRSRKREKSPKFGIIYLSDYIQNAKKEKQGKVARLLASKLMLAARIDFYSKRFEPKLKQELDREIKAME